MNDVPTTVEERLAYCVGEANRAVRAVAAAGGFAALTPDRGDVLATRIHASELRAATSRILAQTMVDVRRRVLESLALLEAAGAEIPADPNRAPWTLEQCLEVIRKSDAERLRARLRAEEGLNPEVPEDT